jgi:hypothetical protein
MLDVGERGPPLERGEGGGVVPVAGIEPATFGLQNRCSTS